jgi:hypothetical protein
VEEPIDSKTTRHADAACAAAVSKVKIKGKGTRGSAQSLRHAAVLAIMTGDSCWGWGMVPRDAGADDGRVIEFSLPDAVHQEVSAAAVPVLVPPVRADFA